MDMQEIAGNNFTVDSINVEEILGLAQDLANGMQDDLGQGFQ